MKKIFTLLLFSGIVSASFAQQAANQRRNGNDEYYSYQHHRDDDNRDGKFYYFSRREMQIKIDEINRFYDDKIEDVKCNRFIRYYRKRRLISELQCRRDEEIKAVYMKFKDPCNRSNDRDYSNRW